MDLADDESEMQLGGIGSWLCRVYTRISESFSLLSGWLAKSKKRAVSSARERPALFYDWPPLLGLHVGASLREATDPVW